MKKLIIFLVIGLILISGCEQQGLKSETTTQEGSTKETVKDYTFLQTITYEDENSTINIVKNKLTKKATVDMEVELLKSELELGELSMVEFTTKMMCGMVALAFFDPEGLEEWIEEMSSQMVAVEDDSPKKETKEDIKDNVLEGYTVTEANILFKDKGTRKKFSDCHVTGKGESNIKINYY